MSFSGLTISSVSFDLEIFPDNSCTSLSGNNCGGRGDPNLPDLTLLANGSQVVEWDALVPGSSGNSHGIDASAYTHSPDSGSHSSEQAPQLLGSSGVWTLPANTTTLDFQDWPATIAINDLVLNYTPNDPPNDPPPAAPEPGSIALLGTALFGYSSAGVGQRKGNRRPRPEAPAAPLSCGLVQLTCDPVTWRCEAHGTARARPEDKLRDAIPDWRRRFGRDCFVARAAPRNDIRRETGRKSRQLGRNPLLVLRRNRMIQQQVAVGWAEHCEVHRSRRTSGFRGALNPSYRAMGLNRR